VGHFARLRQNALKTQRFSHVDNSVENVDNYLQNNYFLILCKPGWNVILSKNIALK